MTQFASNYPDQYRTLLDKEVWEYIERCDRFYPPDTATRPISEQRKIYTNLCREFFAGYPDTVDVEDQVIEQNGLDVSCRFYTNPESRQSPDAKTENTTLVYMHGGGFVVGDLDSHDDICAQLCKLTGLRVVSGDYRLSPEHRHPAALLDTIAVIEWVIGQYEGPVVLCGDSAGANLVCTAAHQLRHVHDNIIGQVLIYPGLGGDIEQGSYQRHAAAPCLTLEDVVFFTGVRLTDEMLAEYQKSPTLKDKTLAPLHDDDFTRLPPTVAFGAECDPLCDDAFHYCDAVTAAGGKAQYIHEPGLVHGYLRARHSVQAATESFNCIVNSILMLVSNEWHDLNES
ncbi:MAG: alpha/beta hydrolase [Granulosicoccus sp.]|nr:alpha/beta hydrolase [Granulosicoccus sp.]